MPTTVYVVLEEDFCPNHFAISLACIAGSSLVSIVVGLNVVEVGLSVLEMIPWPS